MIFLVLASSSDLAQAGFRASVFAYPVFAILNVSTDPTVGRPGLGWGAGGSVEWAPWKWLGFELDFLYTKRVVSGPLSSQNEFTYVQVPFQFRFWPWRYVSFGIGPYVGYALGDVQNSSSTGASGFSYTTLGYTRWDWGAVGTLGVQFPLLKYLYLFLDGRFFYGLQNLEEVSGSSDVSSWMEASILGGIRLGTF